MGLFLELAAQLAEFFLQLLELGEQLARSSCRNGLCGRGAPPGEIIDRRLSRTDRRHARTQRPGKPEREKSRARGQGHSSDRHFISTRRFCA